MLIASYNRTKGIRFRRQYPELVSDLRPILTSLRTSLEKLEEMPASESNIGLKVWLLPPWYARELRDPHSHKVALADFWSSILGRPRVICGGELSINGATTGRSWAIGKGLIGMTTHRSAGKDYRVVEHSDAFLKQMSKMSRAALQALDEKAEAVRAGRTRKDIREVCNTYGTSMAFPLIYDANGITFGCLTLDTPSNVQLDIAAQEACGQVIVEALPGVLETIANWGRYRIG